MQNFQVQFYTYDFHRNFHLQFYACNTNRDANVKSNLPNATTSPILLRSLFFVNVTLNVTLYLLQIPQGLCIFAAQLGRQALMGCTLLPYFG